MIFFECYYNAENSVKVTEIQYLQNYSYSQFKEQRSCPSPEIPQYHQIRHKKALKFVSMKMQDLAMLEK